MYFEFLSLLLQQFLYLTLKLLHPQNSSSLSSNILSKVKWTDWYPGQYFSFDKCKCLTAHSEYKSINLTIESPGVQVLSLGSKAHIEPSGKLVCLSPIQLKPFQNPQLLTVSSGLNGRQVMKAALSKLPSNRVLCVNNHNPSG